MMFKRKGGWGVKGFLNNVKKNCTFLIRRLPSVTSLLDLHFRVYTVMRENKELFGETSFEDVKAQMDLYKA